MRIAIRRWMLTLLVTGIAASGGWGVSMSSPVRGDDVATPASSGDVSTTASEAAVNPAITRKEIVNGQSGLKRDYERFIDDLLQLSESLRGADTERAELLLEARGKTQSARIDSQMAAIIAALEGEQPQFGSAVDRQKEVVRKLEEILKILQTDQERDRLKARIKELEEILKGTNELIGAQTDVRADTERGGDLPNLEGAEARVAKKAEDLARKIDAQDKARAARDGKEEPKPADGKPMEGEGQPMEGEGKPMPGEGQPIPGEGKPMPGEGKPMEGEGKPMEGEAKPMEGEAKPMEGEAKPMEGEAKPMPGEGKPMPGEGKPMPGEGQPMPGEGKPMPGGGKPMPGGDPMPGDDGPPKPQDPSADDPNKTPGREDLEQAREEMEQAIQELKKKKRDSASNEQDAAIAKLEEMKAKIEEILRQLREEERELYLTMLEARFQEMLRLQLRINADTIRLDSKSVAERGEGHVQKSSQLSQEEGQNVLSAEKALVLLKEEGSSVAFPEAVEQMKSNMQEVTRRLGIDADTGDTTQLIEALIVDTLEEMIFSLQQELEKMKDKKKGDPPPPGEPQDPPLVDQLAELKMIRSLQSQIQRLTRQIGLQIDGEEATDDKVRKMLKDELAGRQRRIQEATYDLTTGKNK